MTQEMGESLMYSWLRHVKGCQIVQTNWKASPTWNNEIIDINILKTINKCFTDYKLIKKGYTSEQLLKQTECDVLGIQLSKDKDNIKRKLIAVEVAYHENGLDYGGSKKQTREKVVSKCLRIAMCLNACFPDYSADIYFVTPIVKGKERGNNRSMYELLKSDFDKLNKCKQSLFDYNFHFIANADCDKNQKCSDFNNLVIIPLLLNVDNVADTSELFLRSIQLLKAVRIDIKKEFFTNDYLSVIEPVANIAKTFMIPILKSMSEEDLQRLTKTNDNDENLLGRNLPLLTTNRDNNKDRYYSKAIIEKNNNSYYLCNYWTDSNKQNLIKWILSNTQ